MGKKGKIIPAIMFLLLVVTYAMPLRGEKQLILKQTDGDIPTVLRLKVVAEKIRIRQSDSSKEFSVTMTDGILSKVSTNIDGKVFYIGSKGMESLVMEELEITIPELEGLYVDGMCDVNIGNISTSKTLTLQMTGAGDMHTGDIKVSNMKLVSLGTGDMTLGKIMTSSLDVNNLGSGDIMFKKIDSNTVKVVNGGVGDTNLGIVSADRVELNATGIGDITVKAGKADVATCVSTGVGDINVRGLSVKKMTAIGNSSGSIIGGDSPNVRQSVSTGSNAAGSENDMYGSEDTTYGIEEDEDLDKLSKELEEARQELDLKREELEYRREELERKRGELEQKKRQQILKTSTSRD